MYRLVGLLILQSFSSIILSHFHTLIETHESIIFFLTMLVGAGGNAGGQSVVMAVRGISLGRTMPMKEEIKTGFFLASGLCVVTLQ